MSLLVKQRSQMLEEKQEVPQASKTICKLKCSKRKQQIQKNIFSLLKVPQSLPIFITTNVELKLALSSIEDRCLGGLKENPCTYNYRVTRTDQVRDVYFFTLQQYEKDQLSKEQVQHIIKQLNDPYSQKTLEMIENKYKIIQDFKIAHLISNEQLQKLEELINQHPFQCTIQNVNLKYSNLSQRIINQKLLDLMGITKDMMFSHLNETNALPTIFDHNCSLKNWCELAQYSVDGTQKFSFDLNTYEGQQFKCEVEQIQVYRQSELDPEQIVFLEYRMIKLDDFLKKNLLREERLKENQHEFFNEKYTEVEFNRFKYKTKYKDAKNYFHPKPCGIRDNI